MLKTAKGTQGAEQRALQRILSWSSNAWQSPHKPGCSSLPCSQTWAHTGLRQGRARGNKSAGESSSMWLWQGKPQCHTPCQRSGTCLLWALSRFYYKLIKYINPQDLNNWIKIHQTLKKMQNTENWQEYPLKAFGLNENLLLGFEKSTQRHLSPIICPLELLPSPIKSQSSPSSQKRPE